MKINYFDLGAHVGEEISMFLNEVKNSKYQYSVHAFEAHPEYANKLTEKFKSDTNVYIHNFAISSVEQDMQNIKLYLASSSEGNSIFSSKFNVSLDNYVDVTGISFVNWIKNNIPDLDVCINILRFNIEGAELLLINDIIDQNFVNKFQLYLGSTPGADIRKCKEIAHFYDSHINLLTDNNINILPYCHAFNNYNGNIKIIDTIQKLKFNED